MAGALFAYPATNALETVLKAIPLCQLGRALMLQPPRISLAQNGIVAP